MRAIHLKRTGLILIAVGLLTQNPYVLIFGILLLLIIFLSWFWTHYLLEDLFCTFTLTAHRAQVGDEIQGELTLQNHQPFPIPWLTCSLEWPGELEVEEGSVIPHYLQNRSLLKKSLSLFWFQRVKKKIQARCRQRGEFFFGPIHLSTTDLFGLSTGKKEIPIQEKIIVYPRVLPVSLHPLPHSSPFGEEMKKSWIFEDPICFKGIREYRMGDPFSRIHWKATARTNRLQTRLVDASRARQVALIINTTTGEYLWELDGELLERTIITGASLAARCCQLKHRFGIYLNGLVRGSKTPAAVEMGTGEGHLLACMEVLGRVIPAGNIRCEAILKATIERLGGESEILLITGKINQPIQELIKREAQRGRIITIIQTSHLPQTKPVGVPTYSVQEEETWDALVEITLVPVGY